MSDAPHLRTVIIGLLRFAGAEEELLLASAGSDEGSGGPDKWAAGPLVAHITEFKEQQVQRLRAVRDRATPPTFGEVDHSSADLYDRYRRLSTAVVVADRRRVTDDLIDSLAALDDRDLGDPPAAEWLGGRKLWLQVIVRGFWHPTGHLGDFYLRHGDPVRAVALQRHAVATADYLGAPDPARGMAHYTLACAQALAQAPDDAVASLASAVALNPDLRANVRRDADLAGLRDGGRLEAVLH